MLTLTRFARKSTHTNKSELGTASWDEFDAGLRVRHSEHEAEYTPDVYDCFKVLDWDQEINDFGGAIGEYGDVKMSSTFQSSFRPTFDPLEVSRWAKGQRISCSM